ncbi:hypothetical protein L2E82_05500 [Cichorium intybus]|uniref:Uncharacterized protein n=1 Tax=Cichorium intybus TaxID=13427 RepID=A0ACB9H8K4_CICIN|nr:hypothetical protein L2E82_05500 [Cichorium intybus]
MANNTRKITNLEEAVAKIREEFKASRKENAQQFEDLIWEISDLPNNHQHGSCLSDTGRVRITVAYSGLKFRTHGPCSMNTGRAVLTEANRRNIVDLHGSC